MKALAPNTLLQNRYLIVHLIGKGGMGEVYLAVDQRLGSAVALKRTVYKDDETLSIAFEREARTLARLRHPVLPKVSDHFVEQENQYLVMEHISGDDLSKRLEANKKPFPLSWVLFWADQLLDALSYLHSHEPPIIHRDIKPQNLKLTDDNNIILLDFGLSKNSVGQTISKSSSGGSSSSSHSVVGYTPHYAPMEQIRGTGTNPRSDIYSLSATIYQLLTGSVPPDALSRADTILNGSPDPIRPVSELNTEVAKGVSDVIIKGMSISQDQRFASAREMQKALRDAYAQIQSAMTAQTVAFNAQGEQLMEAAPPVRENIEQPAPSVSVNGDPALQIGIKTEVMPLDLQPDANGEDGAAQSSAAAAENVPEQDFGATATYDLPPKDFSENQSDVKTEIYSGGLPTDLIPAETEETFETGEEDYAPEVDVPVVVLEDEAVESSPVIEQPAGKTIPAAVEETFEPVAATFVPQQQQYENAAQETHYEPVESTMSTPAQATAAGYAQPAALPASKAKSSGGGKMALVIGGIAVLFLFLLGGAGAAGWYYYVNSAGTVEVTEPPTPTPEPTVSVTPTPEPTLAVETNVNTNQDITNTNTETNNQPVLTQENPDRPPTPTQQQQTPVRPTPRQTQAGTTTTPRQTPVKQATPKSTPRRTDILQ